MITSRRATRSDLEAVVEVLTLAFENDPVWGGWAFPDRDRAAEQRREFWRYLVRSGLRFPWVRMTTGGEAAALWLPPGERELTAEDEAALEPFIHDLVGDHAGLFIEGLELFEEHLPKEPHFHLDLLGTHPDHRGKGIGMGLVRAGLEEVDVQHASAYLESTNPANIARYEAVGFRRIDAFTLPGGPTVDTMWRDPR